MDKRERIELAIERAGFGSQEEIAVACGVKQPSVHALLNGTRPMKQLLEKIAEKTGVSHDWLRYGDSDKAPTWARSRIVIDEEAQASRVRENSGHAPIVQVIGAVTAGDGDLDGYEASENIEVIEIPRSWKLIQVHGMSAYPIFYPRQLAWVDIDRAARPEHMGEAQYIDLHDNVVVVQAEVAGKHRALLKRFNYQPESPQKFALSSLDAGRSSPFVPPEAIDIIIPVVGSWWEDPRKPRKKRFHARSVIVKLIDEEKP